MVVSDAHVFPGFLTPVLAQLFSKATCAEVRGENMPERKFASSGYRNHNHQVMSPTRSPLSHPGRHNTTFITCFSRGERRKYARKKFRLVRVLNSQPPGHESDTLTTQPTWRCTTLKKKTLWEKEKILVTMLPVFSPFPWCFQLYQREKLSFYQHSICRLQMLQIRSCPKFCLLVKS